MEFDRIVITIQNVGTEESGPQWTCSIIGYVDERLGDGSELNEEGEPIEIYNEQEVDLGSMTGKTKASVLDFIIEKVEV